VKPSAVPPAALPLFPSDRLEQVGRYAEMLATVGVERGLIGPREAPRLWQRHLINCALLAPELPAGGDVADVGSGAGLPGLVLALARPDASMTLAEPLQRRATFLAEAVDELGLDNVEVRCERAEALHGDRAFDVVTARAVAPLERLLGWCMPLVAPNGRLLAFKGSSAEREVDEAGAVLRRLGCADPSILVLGSSVPDVEETRAVQVTWADPARVSLGPSGCGVVKQRPRKRRR
jgi:16S rRNA (guanine527-N7)-methyltransferase